MQTEGIDTTEALGSTPYRPAEGTESTEGTVLNRDIVPVPHPIGPQRVLKGMICCKALAVSFVPHPIGPQRVLKEHHKTMKRVRFGVPHPIGPQRVLKVKGTQAAYIPSQDVPHPIGPQRVLKADRRWRNTQGIRVPHPIGPQRVLKDTFGRGISFDTTSSTPYRPAEGTESTLLNFSAFVRKCSTPYRPAEGTERTTIVS